jgi:hypothetical protein
MANLAVAIYQEADLINPLAIANSAPIGQPEGLTDILLPSAGTYYIRVFETSFPSGQTQLYTMSIGVSSGENCFTIHNNGQGALDVTSVSKPSWAQLTPPPPYQIPGGQNKQVCATVDCAACSGSGLDGTLTINSNDPDEASVSVSIHVDCPGPLARILTVASSNPNSGVSISVSPNDNGGNGSGTTQFSRTYDNNAVVTITAPSTAAGNAFQRWQRDGSDFGGNDSLTQNVTMDADHTMTAFYVEPTGACCINNNTSTPNITLSACTSQNGQWQGAGSGSCTNCPLISRELLSCTPAHCWIDARIAHDQLNQAIGLNTNMIVANFSSSAVGMTPADFEVTLVPNIPGDIVPGISSVTPSGDNATVVLDQRIQQTRWTCLRDKGSNKRCCIGSLPGDAYNDRISQPDDIFEIYDNLNGAVTPALGIEKCDTDRSGLCTPADLLMAVDVLNGADAFDPVSGNTLPLCPSIVP